MKSYTQLYSTFLPNETILLNREQYFKSLMMNFKNIFQHATMGARIRTRNKIRIIENQNRAVHQKSQQNDKEAFHSLLPKVVDSIARHPAIADITNLENWMKKLLRYNLTGGKAARGQSVVTAYKTLENPDKITEDSLKRARIMGWCVEMFQAYVVILDDIMDNSTTRRGQPCWYRQPDVGVGCAINDAILLYNGMFYLLKETFNDNPNYVDMVDTFNETLLLSAFGQFLDLKTSDQCGKDYQNVFTPERHHAIIKYKAAYYTYDLPIYLGCLLTGNKLDTKMRKQIQDLSLLLGTLFQIQDDYIDCYSEKSLLGKDGSDIQDGKCTWLAVTALQRCNKDQNLVFKVCYGSKEPAHIERVKVLYDQLKLPQLYREVEEKYYDDILGKINELPSGEWKVLFGDLLGITYKRVK